MVFACHRHLLAAAALVLLCGTTPRISAESITTAPNPTATVHSSPETCEFRTINYITDSLPQQCLRSAWSNDNIASYTKSEEAGDTTTTTVPTESTVTPSPGISDNDTTQGTVEGDKTSAPHEPASTALSPLPSPTETNEHHLADTYGGELNESSFMSFEEWKKQTLEKAGQANENIGNKKPIEKKRDSEGTQSNFDSLGDEGEIDLDFGAFGHKGKNGEPTQSSQPGEPEKQQNTQDQDGVPEQKDVYRSKDAGKTYKERFSYASFDAGATILKTHQGAKNAKAVLVENKDSYMLSECTVDNKFLIIELSEDIWIDTLVLANYEFFSSMIRGFSVSVSDRYPVKMDKWKDLGIYEARNSREIQAFLIKNPQIWARYIRIEFLSHYGNEYYCPLSLVRVHGTRMLESWKQSEANGDEDDADEQGAEEQFVPDAVADVVKEEEKLKKESQAAIHDLAKEAELNALDQDKIALDARNLTDTHHLHKDESPQGMTNRWADTGNLTNFFEKILSSQLLEVCQTTDTLSSVAAPSAPGISEVVGNATTKSEDSTATASAADTNVPAPSTAPKDVGTTDPPTEQTSTQPETPSTSTESSNVTSTHQESTTSATPLPVKPQNVTSSQKNKTTSTSSAPSSLPTIQESFFKAVSRRLQLLETNSTLSLGYIEEQSKILREAFTKVEKKQVQKTDSFLDTLNSTVLAELRGFRQQYDQIWQSTVISLESQREESRREILAISTRLNILADEVIFQKRMSIVQSVLLLLCLALVIFSRVSSPGAFDFAGMQMRAPRNHGFATPPDGALLESPSLQRTGSMGHHGQWLGPEHRLSRTPSRQGSPISMYSRSDNALTPDDGESTNNAIYSTSEHLEPPSHPRHPMAWPERNNSVDSALLSPSPIGTPRRRIRLGRHVPSARDSATGADGGYASSPRASLENQSWIGRTQPVERSQPWPSPPPEREYNGSEFGIARKPLPDLPREDD